MAGQRLLPNPARLTQHKQPPSHTNPPRPHKPSTLPCAHPNRTPNASAPKLPRMTRRLQKLFSVHLADQKEAAVAVAVLRGPSRPFVDKKKLQLPFSVALRVLCGQKVLPLPFFAVLRVPSWKKEVAVAVAVLRGPPWPSVSSVDKRCCRCRSSRSFAALRGKKKLPLPLPLPFSVALRVLRVLCGQKVLPLPFFAALRGKKKLPLPFSATLRGQNKINASIPNAFKKACPGFPALAVLVTITTNDYPF